MGGRLWLSVDATGHVELWSEEPELLRGGTWVAPSAPLVESDGDEADALAAVFDLVSGQCIELREVPHGR